MSSNRQKIGAHRRALAGRLFAGVLLIGALAGCESGSSPKQWFGGMIDSWNPPTPQQAVRDAFNVHDADKRREAIALLSAAPFGGEDPYLRTYRLLTDDPDATVRAACAQALGMHGTVEDVPRHLIPLLNDDAAFVRWEAAKALQRIHNPVAVGPLIERVQNDEDADVRMAAARALGQYPQRRVFDVLVGALSDRDFGVVSASHESLMTLTGQELPADSRDWLAWADAHRRELFDNRQRYTYQPYDPPPGLAEKVRFWEAPETVEPRVPTGLEEAKADGGDTSSS